MRCLVTGASGFVGSALVRALLVNGWSVRAVARRDLSQLAALGAETRQLDLAADQDQTAELLRDIDVVFHVASKVAMWGKAADFEKQNVGVTSSLVRAAQAAGVKAFVYTSSPSVVADGGNLRGVDESYPYPAKYLADYPRTKAMAERLVLAADSLSGQMRTVSLRPHLIFGPGDSSLGPAILARAKAGSLVRLGSGDPVVDFTFIDDCVNAHILAAEALLERPKFIGGSAFFISQGDPTPFWDWVNGYIAHAGLPPIVKRLPVTAAYGVATICEAACRLIPLFGEPRVTRFLVKEMATDHYFSIDRARDLLGFRPSTSVMGALAEMSC